MASISPLNDGDRETFAYLKHYIETNGYAPTLREMATDLGIGASTANFRIGKLEDWQLIERDRRTVRGIRLVATSAEA